MATRGTEHEEWQPAPHERSPMPGSPPTPWHPPSRRVAYAAVGTLVVMAAHAIETPRILLSSATSALPNGVANRSRLVGCNLMDHPVQLSWALMKDPVYPFRGPLSTSGIESLRDGAFRTQRAPFRMEMGNEGWNWPNNDPYTTVNDAVTGNGAGGDLRPGGRIGGHGHEGSFSGRR